MITTFFTIFAVMLIGAALFLLGKWAEKEHLQRELAFLDEQIPRFDLRASFDPDPSYKETLDHYVARRSEIQATLTA